MQFDDVVTGRRSIRGYKSEPVPKALIEEVLALAMRSPSSMNTQPWNFTVVSGEPLDLIRAGNTERNLAGVPHSREFRIGQAFAGQHRDRQVGVAKQLFAAMDIAREDKEKRQDWVFVAKAGQGRNAATARVVNFSVFKAQKRRRFCNTLPLGNHGVCRKAVIGPTQCNGFHNDLIVRNLCVFSHDGRLHDALAVDHRAEASRPCCVYQCCGDGPAVKCRIVAVREYRIVSNDDAHWGIELTEAA